MKITNSISTYYHLLFRYGGGSPDGKGGSQISPRARLVRMVSWDGQVLVDLGWLEYWTKELILKTVSEA